jgi:ATP phosphoribosyltransferase regulatory subunit
VVLLVADAVRSAGLKQFRFRFGDIALFYALLDALSLPERWRLKLRHYFWRPPAFHALLSRLAKGEAPNSNGPVAALAATLADKDQARAEELVVNYLESNGLPLSGNRTLGEIAERLLEHGADLRSEPLPREVATVIDYYLAVEASPRETIDRIAMIAKGAGIDLGPALYMLSRRFDLLQERGIDVGAASFATEFGRDLEYYSGLVFQIETAGDKTSPIAGGGRYDGLLRSVGAPGEVPAVGSAIHTERLLAAIEGES